MKGANESTELRRHPKVMNVSQGMQWSLVKYMMHQGKYHWTANLLFDWFRFDQSGKLLFIQLKQTS